MSFTKTVSVIPRALIAILALALVVAACGGSSSTGTTNAPSALSTPSQPTTTTTTTSTAPTTTTTTTAATTTSANAGSPPCTAADLSLSYLGGLGAGGHGKLGFALRNTGTQPCTTIGYPGIQFLDRAGGALPTTPTHSTQDYFGSIPKTFLTVAPGATVSFRLDVTHGAAPAGCATAYGLQVIAPNDTATLRVSIPNGEYECQTATVSPLAQGTSAFS